MECEVPDFQNVSLFRSKLHGYVGGKLSIRLVHFGKEIVAVLVVVKRMMMLQPVLLYYDSASFMVLLIGRSVDPI